MPSGSGVSRVLPISLIERGGVPRLHLRVTEGGVAAVVGPNGAGKTTLLNLLVGLLPPSSGTAKVFGEIPDNTTTFLARVGFVAQDTPLYRDFTAADHLRMVKHLISDLAHVCDFLVVIVGGELRLVGDIDEQRDHHPNGGGVNFQSASGGQVSTGVDTHIH